MSERLRIFDGATELSISNPLFIKSNNRVVNQLTFDMLANSNLVKGDVVDVTKKNGSTTVFSAKVVNITKKNPLWSITAFANGYELSNTPVQTVYVTGTTPEEIVEDIVDNYTNNLTYASSGVSGITLNEDYIADGYAIDIIQDMITLLQWRLRIDFDDNVYFEPDGTVNNGRTFTNGSDFQIEEWGNSDIEYFNSVKVIGGFESYMTEETLSGTDTSFTLTEKPSGSVRITVSGSEISSDDYIVRPETKEIEFTSSKTDPTVSYEIKMPIVVWYQDDAAINSYGQEVYKKIEVPHINSYGDCRQYAKNIVTTHSSGYNSAIGYYNGLDFDIDCNEEVIISDPIRTITSNLVIQKVTFDGSQGMTKIECGNKDDDLVDWQTEVQERIKTIEQKTTSENVTTFVKLAKHTMKVTLNISSVFEKNSPQNSFIVGHQTLCNVRGHDNEIDCSTNSMVGTWAGTGVTTGSQYSTSGWRLSCGTFNGTDQVISYPHNSVLNITNDISFMFGINIASNPGAIQHILNKFSSSEGYYIYLNTDGTISFCYQDSGSGALQTCTTTSSLTTSTWVKVFIVKDDTSVKIYFDDTEVYSGTKSYSTIGTNASSLYIGNDGSSSWFSGSLDEVRVYSSAITSGNRTDLLNLLQFDTNLQLYASMDNPLVGDYSTAREAF